MQEKDEFLAAFYDISLIGQERLYFIIFPKKEDILLKGNIFRTSGHYVTVIPL